MKKTILILILFAIIVFGSLIFYLELKKEKPMNFSEESTVENTNMINLETNISNESKGKASETTEIPNSKAGGSSGGGGTAGSGIQTSEKKFPEDIEMMPCGFYYEGYEACKGYCPEGTCVSEGRSCYCKK